MIRHNVISSGLVMGRIKTAVNTVLEAKGLREVSSSPDVYVAGHAAIEGKMSYETSTQQRRVRMGPVRLRRSGQAFPGPGIAPGSPANGM
jgi:hypothetical protein